jgi:O-acetyl-ADP-ribose deacetylase (regulator of RNase III)
MGFMDGGIDRHYAAFFGPTLAERVRDAVLAQPEGHLPIGAAVAVPTGHIRIRHLVLAPTMISPEHVPAVNAYRALRAALRLMTRSPELGPILYSPGLTTLVGGVAPADAANEMALAYADWKTATRTQARSSTDD